MQNVDDNLKYYHTYPYTTSIYLCFFWAPQLFLGPLCATSFKESSKDLITQIAIISDNYFITNIYDDYSEHVFVLGVQLDAF